MFFINATVHYKVCNILCLKNRLTHVFPMTTMLGVRTSSHCKTDQTHFVWGIYTESDSAPAQKRVCPCKII